jgi:hypothetical protein
MAGLVGIAALARLLARRERAARRETAALPAPDPAEELRRKLSESRDVPEVTTAAPAEAPTGTLEERRARVHAKAQEAMGAMESLAPPAAEAEATEAQEPRP